MNNQIIKLPEPKTPLFPEEERRAQMVSAKELYEFLGFHLDNWSKWSRRNIEENNCFDEGKDYEVVRTKYERFNPNPSKDFRVSLEMAKYLAIASKSPRSREIHDYFLSCEQKLAQVKARVFDTSESYEILTEAHKKLADLQEQIRNQKLLGSRRVRKSQNPIYKFLTGEEAEEFASRWNVHPCTVHRALSFKLNSQRCREIRMHAWQYVNLKTKEMMDKIDQAEKEMQFLPVPPDGQTEFPSKKEAQPEAEAQDDLP